MTSSTQSLPILNLLKTVHKLRAPDGCPWDRKQTHQSLRPYLVEETYEALEILDQLDPNLTLKNQEPLSKKLREELGDILMQVVLHAELAEEVGAFSFQEIAQSLDQKLISRHPHVFGDRKAANAEEAVGVWEQQKRKEREALPEPESVLAGIPRGLPGLLRAQRVIEKVTRVGFQWPTLEGPLQKLEEELGEFQREVAKVTKDAPIEKLQVSPQVRTRLEEELGDLFFSLCNVAFALKISPEDALRGMLKRFESRFRWVETEVRKAGKEPQDCTLEELDRYWDQAKRQ
jgi:tetrapyrrole methylase family protein/MazG family protein